MIFSPHNSNNFLKTLQKHNSRWDYNDSAQNNEKVTVCTAVTTDQNTNLPFSYWSLIYSVVLSTKYTLCIKGM